MKLAKGGVSDGRRRTGKKRWGGRGRPQKNNVPALRGDRWTGRRVESRKVSSGGKKKHGRKGEKLPRGPEGGGSSVALRKGSQINPTNLEFSALPAIGSTGKLLKAYRRMPSNSGTESSEEPPQTPPEVKM